MEVSTIELRFALAGIPLIILIGILTCTTVRDAANYGVGIAVTATYAMLRDLFVWLLRDDGKGYQAANKRNGRG